MKFLLCAIIGYIVGSLSPSALISRLKHDNLRERGTGNLGATNVTMVYGRTYGIIVMVFDIAKSFVVFKISQHLIFHNEAKWALVAGMLASGMSVVGHIFPFYMRFKGGKGVATFAGMVLAYDPLLVLLLIIVGFLLMVIFNYGFMLTVSCAILFCVITTVIEKDIWIFLITAVVAALITWKHLSNILKAGTPNEIRARDYMRRFIFKKKD